MKIMEEVCDLMPESYKDECDDFVDKYGTQIVEFLLSSAAPHTICTLLHLCFFKAQPLPGQSHVYNEYIGHLLLIGLTLTSHFHHDINALLIPQSCSSPRIVSRAARWLC